ncbi:hypothetical protein NEUTE1DRAFT_143622 [Neurospora tetrasperma FGSC 2508]|uniref:Uncharacterized protein n=1 Tax=Neurospora tetrasperma (strain FGSC 2508 / ATCC MYA-4615 / P0657) TaxID=510951 RepID=F8MAL0_NEUT8|nr:uncharacterized protein NEUTE1DRAFT_143622 [Neurospora tetrasperma FGSC 2508]EGO60131.1 hypothetical protein NEUTE1DRAFT_143622 [Neurospora tetrasperma FGSC 2508]EGZ75916.1 hypothetical protein NEUTE2DRAFT_156274 [Neurospora tetrasperma FGSC 2509]
MPTINLPAGSSTQLEPRPAHQHHLRFLAVHAYLGIAVTLIIVTIWCVNPRRRSSTSSSANCGSQPEVKEIKASSGRVKLVRTELTEGSHPKRFSQNLVLATPTSMHKLSHSLSSAYTKVPHPSRHPQTMDGDQNNQHSHRSDPEATASRGTSQKPMSSSSSSSSSTLDQLHGHMPPSKTFTSSDGTTSPGLTSREGGRGPKHLHTESRQIDGFGISTAQRENNELHGVSVGEPRLHFTTPPPPPPLTPPTLDKTAFAFQHRQPTSVVLIPPGLDGSFIHQPDLNYIGHTSSFDIPSSIPADAAAIPRRRSYTKSVPVGVPIPSSSSSLSRGTTVTSSSAFHPSSDLPPSPLFPRPPPVSQDYQFVGGHMEHRASVGNRHQNETEVHGEIISVINDDGHGWQRHTQVYGGGVCLACLGNEGGFYGPNVPLEDRRY